MNTLPPPPFLPLFSHQENPNNSAVLWPSLVDLAASYIDAACPPGSPQSAGTQAGADQREQLLSLVQAELEGRPDVCAELARLSVARDGWDGRLPAAYELVAGAVQGGSGSTGQVRKPSLVQVVKGAAQARLRLLEAAAAAVAATEGGERGGRGAAALALACAFRERQAELLREVLGKLG